MVLINFFLTYCGNFIYNNSILFLFSSSSFNYKIEIKIHSLVSFNSLVDITNQSISINIGIISIFS